MPLRKKVSYVGLKDFDYLIRDTSLTSPDFFNVVYFPEKFKAGKNLFKLRAHPTNLVNFSEIFIEILDFNGNPVYYEPINYIEKDGTRVIAVYIYEDTSPDTCTVYLAGRTAVNPLTGETILASVEDRTRPNVLWSRNITIAPDDRNDVEIIFTQYPSLVVSEVVQAYQQPSNVYNVFTQLTASGATMTISPAPSQVIGSIINSTIGGPTGPGTTTPQGAGSSGTPSFGNQFYDLTATENTLALSNGATALSPPLNTLNGYSLLTTTGFPLTAAMEGGVIVVKQPSISIQPLTRGKGNLIYPNSQINETNASYSTSPSQLSGSIKFAVVNVINSTQALVSQFAGFKNQSDNTYGPFNIIVRRLQTAALGGGGGGGGYTNYNITSLQASTNFTASFIQPTAIVLTQNSASFADIILSDIEPSTGDVYKIKTLYKPSGFFGDFIDLGDTILEQTDLLIDTGSLETNVVVGSYYENYGRFDNLAEIDQYWTTSSLGSVSNPFTLTYDNDTIIGGARLLANWSPPNQYIASIGDACIFNIREQYRPQVSKNTEYLVKFRIANDTTIGNYTSNDTNIPNARLDVYISGSRITYLDELRYTQAGEIVTVPNINATLVGNFRDNGPLGTRIGTYQVKHTPSSYGNVVFRFKAEDTAPIDIKFVTRRGSFIIADIQLLADKETGYSPNYTRISKRIPTEHLNTPLTFKFQYFDYRSNKADLESIAFGSVFDGDNTYIDGTNNLITGSIFLSNQTNSGIEMAGVSSGFIRSVGFRGVDSSSNGGFIFYSGSVLRSTTNEFISGGVGFTAAATPESYIRVNTINEELTIKSAGFTLSATKGGNVITSFTGSVGISGDTIHDGYIQLNPTIDPGNVTPSSSFLFQSASNTNLASDLYIRQGAQYVKFNWLADTLYTSLLYGGVVTYSGNTVYISSGSGIVVDHNANAINESAPTIQYVTWPNLSFVPTYINVRQVTYLAIDSGSNVYQNYDPFNNDDFRDKIVLGAVAHFDLANVTAFQGAAHTAYDQQNQINTFIDAFGPLKLTGYELTAQPSSFKLSTATGTSFIHGGFYDTDPDRPSNITTAAQATASLAYIWRNGGGGIYFDTNGGAFYTNVTSSKYDDGTGTLATVSNNNWTIQRVTIDPRTGKLYIYYGQNIYTTLDDALTNLPTDSFTEGDTKDFTTFLGYLVVKSNTTNLANTTDNAILNSGLFRGIGGGGGGTGGGGAGTPGGSSTQIQYNNGGTFDGSANFTFNNTTNTINITGSLVVSGSSTFRNIGPTQLTGSTYISSSDATQLQVGSNLLFVSSSGRVGIRNTTPNSDLEIYGVGSGDGTLRLTRGNNNANYVALSGGTSGAIYNINTSGVQDHIFQTAGTERMRISGSGTVGIGNTGVVNTALAITANGAGGGNFILQGYDSSAVNRFLVTATGRLQITGTSDTGTTGTDERVRLTYNFSPTSGTREHMGIYLVQAVSQSGGANGITRGIYVQPTLTSAANYRAIETTSGSILFSHGASTLLFASSSGNVGIGTLTPASALSVSGRAGISARLRVGATGDPNYTMEVWGDQIFSTGAGAIWSTFVQSTERLGIGTSAPSSKVHIKGAGATSATTALRVENTNGSASLAVRDDGSNLFVGSNGTSAGTWIDNTGSLSIIRSNLGTTYGLRVYNGAGWSGHNAIQAIAYQYPIYGAQGSNGSETASPLSAGAGVYGQGGVGVYGKGITPSGDTGSIGVMATSLYVQSAGNTSLYNRSASAHIIGTSIFSGSVTIIGSLIAPSITGSLQGTASWATNALTASAAGTNRQIQYNNGGVLGATSSFTFNSGNGLLTVNGSITTNNATVNGLLAVSGSSIITGSLQVGVPGTNNPAIDSTVGTLSRGSVTSIDWINRNLQDTSTLTSADWENRVLYDTSTATSIDWNGRALYTPNGATAFDYSTTADDTIASQLYIGNYTSGQVQRNLTENNLYSGHVIQGTIDASVTAYDIVYLDVDGIWYPLKNLPTVSTKMLGIEVDGSILIDGDTTVSDDGSVGTYVVSADHGLPVYLSGTTGRLTTVQPSSDVIRVVGHIYYQNPVSTNVWLMKFRPSNDWYEI